MNSIPNNDIEFDGMSNGNDSQLFASKEDKLLLKLPILITTTTTSTITTTTTRKPFTSKTSTSIPINNNNIKLPTTKGREKEENTDSDIGKHNHIQEITLALLESSFCEERKDNYKQITMALKEHISNILGIHIQDIVIDEIYAENSNKLFSGYEKCNLPNGKLKGIIFDLSIIKNILIDYPTYNDIERITLIENEFNNKYGKIILWKRNIDSINNEHNPFCQASLKTTNNIKFMCINNPIYCIHNNEYKCYTNPMGIDCFCYNDQSIYNHIQNNQYNITYPMTNECKTIISCTNDITLPIIPRCSTSPYSIGCPCNLNPYSKLCGCYINPFNPGCHCTYNPNSNDCKCLLNPEECKHENGLDIIDYEIIDRGPFDLKHGLRRFYKKHFRKSNSLPIFSNYHILQSLLIIFLNMMILYINA
ncbi:Uncharacterized protein CTYZ_00002563 [Cryptosporidium tyzzeri]|nr:Uncharacterized protein CTYZ_00002563 [Cryptosporidium tyzzeri]